MATVIGIISDTHGLLRPEAIDALKECELIVHAGDIGNQRVLEDLRNLAPVVAVRGNVDRDAWADAVPETELFEHKGRFFYVLHDVNQLDLDPIAAEIDAVISGHSHQPKYAKQQGIIYFNPGSAGPRRFKLPICVGKIYLDKQGINAEHIKLID